MREELDAVERHPTDLVEPCDSAASTRGGAAIAALRPVMGFRDLLLFYIVTGFSVRWIAQAAHGGPSALVIWVAC